MAQCLLFSIILAVLYLIYADFCNDVGRLILDCYRYLEAYLHINLNAYGASMTLRTKPYGLFCSGISGLLCRILKGEKTTTSKESMRYTMLLSTDYIHGPKLLTRFLSCVILKVRG